MVSVEDDDLAGLEDLSSDGEDDNYEVELTDGETASSGIPSVRKPNKKRARGIFFLSNNSTLLVYDKDLVMIIKLLPFHFTLKISRG